MNDLKSIKIPSLREELIIFYAMAVSCILLAFLQPNIFHAFNFQGSIGVKFSMQVSAILVGFISILMGFVDIFRQNQIAQARMRLSFLRNRESDKFDAAMESLGSKKNIEVIYLYPCVKSLMDKTAVSISNFNLVVKHVRSHSLVFLTISVFFYIFSAG